MTSEAASHRPHRPILVVTLVGLACLGMLEVGLRLAGRPPSSNTDGIFEEYGNGAYRLQRNVSRRSVTRSFDFLIRTNAFGLRDRTSGTRDLARPYDAWMGDSATFGNGVDYDQSYVGVFGDLAARRGIDVVNLAVGGHHIAEQQAMLREFLAVAPRPPLRVIFVFTPQTLALFDARYDDLMVRDGYLFPRKNWRIPYVLMRLGNASSAYCFFRDAIRRLQHRWIPRSPPATPAGDDGGLLGGHPDPEMSKRFDATLSDLDAQIRGSGAEPIYVYLPTAVDLGKPEARADARRLAAGGAAPGLDALVRHGERAGIRVVDLWPFLQKLNDSGESMTFMEDMHFRASIHALIGQALFEQIVGEDPRPSPAR